LVSRRLLFNLLPLRHTMPCQCASRNTFLTNLLLPGSDHHIQSGLDTNKVEGSPTVRFASVNEEIEPANVPSLDTSPPTQNISGTDQEQIKELSKTLQDTHLQKRRMSHFDFEPVSLPASRVRLRLLSFLGAYYARHAREQRGNVVWAIVSAIIRQVIMGTKFNCPRYSWDTGTHRRYALGITIYGSTPTRH